MFDYFLMSDPLKKFSKRTFSILGIDISYDIVYILIVPI